MARLEVPEVSTEPALVRAVVEDPQAWVVSVAVAEVAAAAVAAAAALGVVAVAAAAAGEGGNDYEME